MMQQQGSPLVGGCNDEVAGIGALTGDGIALAEEPWNEEPDDLDIADLPVALRAMVSLSDCSLNHAPLSFKVFF